MLRKKWFKGEGDLNPIFSPPPVVLGIDDSTVQCLRAIPPDQLQFYYFQIIIPINRRSVLNSMHLFMTKDHRDKMFALFASYHIIKEDTVSPLFFTSSPAKLILHLPVLDVFDGEISLQRLKKETIVKFPVKFFRWRKKIGKDKYMYLIIIPKFIDRSGGICVEEHSDSGY